MERRGVNNGDVSLIYDFLGYNFCNNPIYSQIQVEKEADYIGLMLMASAGYDPRVAVEMWEEHGKLLEEEDRISVILWEKKLDRISDILWEKLDKMFGWNYFSTHPSEIERAQLLAQPKIMEEILTIYIEM